MRNLILILASVATILVAGYVHGRLTDRWSLSTDLADAAARLQRVPESFGDWVSVPSKVDEESVTVANATAHICRTYTNTRTKSQFTLYLSCARPGIVAAHPPDVCYPASGYEMANRIQRELPGYGSAWQAEFTAPTANRELIRVIWSWGVGSKWYAADSPRLSFADSSFLYKIYIIHRLGAPSQIDDESLQEIVDKITAALNPAAQ